MKKKDENGTGIFVVFKKTFFRKMVYLGNYDYKKQKINLLTEKC